VGLSCGALACVACVRTSAPAADQGAEAGIVTSAPGAQAVQPPPAASASAPSELPPQVFLDQDAAALADAGPGFQGEIVGTISPKNETYHFVCRGARCRWDDRSILGYRVYDTDARVLLSVLLRDRMVLRIPLDSLDAGAPDLDAGRWTYTVFDPNGRVAQEHCERANVTDGVRRYQACIASGMPLLPVYLLSAVSPFLGDLEARGRLPLVSIEVLPRDAGGAAEDGPARFMVSTITRRAVGVDEVRVPPFPVHDVASMNVGSRKLY
jgi:hypothetical protein